MVGVKSIQDEMKTNKNVTLEDIKALREWARKQPHLPNTDLLPDILLACFIRRRYGSVERAKETLDNYLTFKALAPELYADRFTRLPDMQAFFSMNHSAMLDGNDFDGYPVVLQCLNETDFKKYNFDAALKAILMVVESYFYETGTAAGLTTVIDQKNFSLNHLAKVPLTTLKKLNYFNKECSPVSLKKIYVINATSFIQTILSVIKPVLHGELFKRIVIFTPNQIDELYKYVPKEILPKEYGGNAGSFEDLHNKSLRRIKRQEELFAKIDKLKVDESQRRGPEKNSSTLFGLEGSFKKLNVD